MFLYPLTYEQGIWGNFIMNTAEQQSAYIANGWSEYGSYANPITLDDEFPQPTSWRTLFDMPGTLHHEPNGFDNGVSTEHADINNASTDLAKQITARYRINARNIFLTYPRCLLDKQTVLDKLVDLMKPRYAVVSLEKHEDGTPHLHALLCLNKKVDIRNERYFDIQGYHPNIQSAKHLGKTKNYVCKDKDIIEYGEFSESKRGPNRIPELDDGMSKLQFLTECYNNDIPYGYAAAFYGCFLDPVNNVTLFEYESDIVLPSNYLNSLTPLNPLFPSLRTPYFSLVVVGPAGCGKTIWCKRYCEKPALWVTHLDDLKLFDKKLHKSIVFDDMCFSYLPVQGQISIVDRYDDRSIHCRYNVAKIPAGIPKYFTCNELPFTYTDAIKRRQILLECTTHGCDNWDITIPKG